jgi:DNA-binding transcriptional ArsR family regulator
MDRTERLVYARLYRWLTSSRAGDTRREILSALKGTDTIPADILCDSSGLSRSTLDNHLRDLENMNIIERIGNPTIVRVDQAELVELILRDLND